MRLFFNKTISVDLLKSGLIGRLPFPPVFSVRFPFCLDFERRPRSCLNLVQSHTTFSQFENQGVWRIPHFFTTCSPSDLWPVRHSDKSKRAFRPVLCPGYDPASLSHDSSYRNETTLHFWTRYHPHLTRNTTKTVSLWYESCISKLLSRLFAMPKSYLLIRNLSGKFHSKRFSLKPFSPFLLLQSFGTHINCLPVFWRKFESAWNEYEVSAYCA